jgi:hypothetical protein
MAVASPDRKNKGLQVRIPAWLGGNGRTSAGNPFVFSALRPRRDEKRENSFTKRGETRLSGA